MEGDGPSGLRRTLSRTMSSLFPNLYRFSNFSGLSEDEIYAAITQQLEQQQSEEENSPETEEFHDPKSPPCVSSKSSSESECFYDAIGAAAQSPQSKKSPVSPLQSKDSLAVSGTPRGSMFDSLSDGESTLSEALRSSSSTPKSFTIITTPPQRFSPVPDSRCSFLEFLQESEKGSLLQAEEEPVDMLTVLRDNEPNEQATEAVNVLYGQQNLDEEIDLKTALETTSDFSQEANLNASPLETQQQNSHTRLSRSSNVHENSSLSELRSALGSATEIVEDFGNNLRRSLFVRHPPPPEHRRRGSFLKRTIPLAGFFDETSENDDRFETDSMISTLTDALTLKSTTELSSNPARLTRTASVLIPTTSTEADRFESERKLRASRRYKPVPVRRRHLKLKAVYNGFVRHTFSRLR